MEGKIYGEELVSLAAAAQALGTTGLNVRMQIKRGNLDGVEIDGDWRVTAGSLSAFLRRGGKNGMPPVCRSGCRKSGGCRICG